MNWCYHAAMYANRYRTGGLLLVAAALLAPAFVHAQTVTGTDFELKSATGSTTARLTTSKEGTPALFFFDAHNVPRISVGLYQDGAPGIVLNDNQGRPAALLQLVDTTGNPVLVLKKGGTDRVVIDQNGVLQSATSTLITVFAGIAAGFCGGMLAAYFILRRMRT